MVISRAMSADFNLEGTKPKKIYFWALDLLRFLLATWVVIFHWSRMPEFSSSFQYNINQYVYRFTEFGWTAVRIFFIISGVVIAQSCLGQSATDFTAKRFGRLAPWILFIFPINFVILVWIKHYFSSLQVLSSLSFYNWSRDFDDSFYPTYKFPSFSAVTWTIFVEILFYISIAVFVIIRGKRRKLALANFANVWLLLLFLAPVVSLKLFDRLIMRPYAPYFIMGIFLYLLATERKSISLLLRATLTGYFCVNDFSSHPAFEFIIFCLVFMACVSAVFLRTPKRGLGTLRDLGNSAYPIYLLHTIIGEQLLSKLFSVQENAGIGFSLNLIISFTITFTIIFLISFYGSRHFERTFRRLLERHF